MKKDKQDAFIQSQKQQESQSTQIDANISFQNDTSKDQSTKINIEGSNKQLNFNQKSTMNNKGRKRKTAKDDTCSDMQIRNIGLRMSFHHQMEQ